jgi:LysM repeat protein
MWRTSVGGSAAGLMLMLALAACGSDSGTGAPATDSTALPPPSATAAPTTTVPATTTTLAQYYEVESGDSLSAIAAKFDVRFEDLVLLNQITNPDHIQVGDTLLIPPPTILLNDVVTTLSVSSSAP